MIALLANAAKKKRAATMRPPPASAEPPEPVARGGFMDELRRGMEDLQRVEQQQKDPATSGTAPAGPQTRPQSDAQARLAATWLEQQKRRAAERRGRGQPSAKAMERVVVLPQGYDAVPPPDDQPDTTNYDEAPPQRAAMQSRIVVAPAEEPAAAGTAAGAPDSGTRLTGRRLQRFADGSARGAIVLSEILGRPVGERPPDE